MAMGAMRMSINEKQFIEAALRENQRIDGRTPFDFRRLVINFSKYVCMCVCLFPLL
jgi:exosome complex component RRP45